MLPQILNSVVSYRRHKALQGCTDRTVDCTIDCICRALGPTSTSALQASRQIWSFATGLEGGQGREGLEWNVQLATLPPVHHNDPDALKQGLAEGLAK